MSRWRAKDLQLERAARWLVRLSSLCHWLHDRGRIPMLGAFGEIDSDLAVRDWQGRAAILAITLWLIWLFLQINTQVPWPTTVMPPTEAAYGT
jgi:hypothetical protein